MIGPRIVGESKHAHFRGSERIDIETKPQYEVAPSTLRLRVEVSALCGSDKRLFYSGSNFTPGHEIGGVVMSVGDGVDKRLVGGRGVVYIPVFCGYCPNCRLGFTNGCLNLEDLIGWQRDGGYSEFVDIPSQCFIDVPQWLPLELAVLGLDTVGTAAHGIRMALRAAQRPIERTAVLGCGPLGLGVIAVLANMGLPVPEIFDPVESRMAAGLALGAIPLSSDSRSQFDIVVEASGSDAARSMAQAIARAGGVLVAFGESDHPYVIPATRSTRRTNLATLRTFYFPLSEVVENWNLLREIGPHLLSTMDTPITLEDLPRAFAQFVAGETIKPMIRFDRAKE